ncbi:hypothetical protein [Pseudomonas sp. Irchel 3E13]|uniref:hypothetical protein n=1 Tax=Pseudomonas sp. Irchel 3E13 TaxID=2008975 RepID=UPI000BA3B110|nr:hypothetical protein [Pseudomonas sp. Irchel 3E13]
MLLASKSGNISAAKLVSETDTEWQLQVEKRELSISKTDKQMRAFKDMSEALTWAGAEAELIEHFRAQDEAKADEGTQPQH